MKNDGTVDEREEYGVQKPKDFLIALGTVLFSLRKYNGFTVDDIVERVGISSATLSRIENGNVAPSVISIWKLCATYGVSMSSVFEHVENCKNDPVMMQIFKKITKLNSTQRKVILDLLDNF